jgi:hypothetical protein
MPFTLDVLRDPNRRYEGPLTLGQTILRHELLVQPTPPARYSLSRSYVMQQYLKEKGERIAAESRRPEERPVEGGVK